MQGIEKTKFNLHSALGSFWSISLRAEIYPSIIKLMGYRRGAQPLKNRLLLRSTTVGGGGNPKGSQSHTYCFGNVDLCRRAVFEEKIFF